MATKNNPGEYDCYAKADPDEPMFTLLARDPSAPTIIEAWCQDRLMRGLVYNEETEAQIKEARCCAFNMKRWFDENRLAGTGGTHTLYQSSIVFTEDLTQDEMDNLNAIFTTDVVDMDERTLLLRSAQCPYTGEVAQLSHVALQKVTFNMDALGDIVDMQNGDRYVMTDEGWEKIEEGV